MNKFHWVSELVCKYEIKCTPKQFDETLKIYELADNGYIYISGFDAIHIAHMNGRPVSSGLDNGYYRLINDGSRRALINFRKTIDKDMPKCYNKYIANEEDEKHEQRNNDRTGER